MSNVPPCQSCGACCFSRLETYARVTGADYERLGELAAEVSSFVGNRCYMRMDDGHCGQLGVDRAGRFVCNVYERRPEVCRELAHASPACAGERESKGVRAARGLLRLRLAH